MIDLYTFRLGKGSHIRPSEGLCAMEAVAWMAGERHSHQPACACPVLSAFTMRANDLMDEDSRRLLHPLILKLIGTRSPEHENLRKEHLVREVTRRVVPMWFEYAGLSEEATRLRRLPSTITMEALKEEAVAAKKRATASEAATAAAYASSFSTHAGAIAAYAASDAVYAAAASFATVAGVEKFRVRIWPTVVAILNEAIELGPYNREEFYDIPMLQQRVAKYRQEMCSI